MSEPMQDMARMAKAADVEQDLVDKLARYRAVAIRLGATPEMFDDEYDQKLVAWHAQQEARVVDLERQLAEALHWKDKMADVAGRNRERVDAAESALAAERAAREKAEVERDVAIKEHDRVAASLRAAEAKLAKERDDKDGITRHAMKLEARLARVVEKVSSALCTVVEGPEVMRSADVRRHVEQDLQAALAAAQAAASQEKEPGDCGCEGRCLGHCETCGLALEEEVLHECPPGFLEQPK